jgi:hypothetical protein
MGLCTNCVSVHKATTDARRWTCSNTNNSKQDNVTGIYYEPCCYCVNGEGHCNFYSDGTLTAISPSVTAQQSSLSGKTTDSFSISCFVEEPESYETQIYQWYERVYTGSDFTDTELDDKTTKSIALSSLTTGTHYYCMKATNTYNGVSISSTSDVIQVIVSAS